MLNWLFKRSSIHKEMDTKILALQSTLQTTEAHYAGRIEAMQESESNLKAIVDTLSMRCLGARVFASNPTPQFTEGEALRLPMQPKSSPKDLAQEAIRNARKTMENLWNGDAPKV